ncbi:hypothetical protein PR202_ga28457 [Eleusine coracana subsp. coracana]|uniref:Secreted protein n=1 Tax=Eleusine coracana subsp. coracana TaxID=191504 RepID=A0AAV5DJ54_ELECO|nr:hypothetical protein PR202_ga28457 [Eleusine coracana subsp. coracana]
MATMAACCFGCGVAGPKATARGSSCPPSDVTLLHSLPRAACSLQCQIWGPPSYGGGVPSTPSSSAALGRRWLSGLHPSAPRI